MRNKRHHSCRPNVSIQMIRCTIKRTHHIDPSLKLFGPSPTTGDGETIKKNLKFKIFSEKCLINWKEMEWQPKLSKITKNRSNQRLVTFHIGGLVTHSGHRLCCKQDVRQNVWMLSHTIWCCWFKQRCCSCFCGGWLYLRCSQEWMGWNVGVYTGSNAYGQLGNLQDKNITPMDMVGLESGVLDVASGSSHSCVLLSSGGVKCWGLNNGCQVGEK